MKKDNVINWEIDVPIFRNPVILRQLFLAIGIPFTLLLVILIITTGEKFFNRYTLYALSLVGLLFLATYIFILLVYGGKYAAGFIINNKGILNYTQKKQAKKNFIINIVAVVLGVLCSRPGVSGAGLLAQSRQSVYVRWDSIKSVKYNSKSKTIIINGGLGKKTAIFCTKSNYDEIEMLIKLRIEP